MRKTILIIEYSNVDMTILYSYLQKQYKVINASSGKEGLAILAENYKKLSAIFLDLIMPGIDGFEVLRKIKDEPLFQHIPIIVTTSLTDEDSIEKALKLGATTYITKPYNQKILLEILLNVISLCEKAALSITTYRDKLTGLYNRETFFEEASKLIKNHDEGYYIFSYLNIERFKVINEQYGQEVGDKVLKHIGYCLNEVMVKLEGLSARFTNDNFALIFPKKNKDTEELKLLHKKITELPFLKQQLTIRIGRNL